MGKGKKKKNKTSQRGNSSKKLKKKNKAWKPQNAQAALFHVIEDQATTASYHVNENQAMTAPFHVAQNQAATAPYHVNENQAMTAPYHVNQNQAMTAPYHVNHSQATTLPYPVIRNQARTLPCPVIRNQAIAAPIHVMEYQVTTKDGNKELDSSKNGVAGFIFMCSGKTKSECFQYCVFGLPAGQLQDVEKIKEGARLYLFDYNLKLLYGIFKATSNGGRSLEPNAFGGGFPAQVKFELLKDCTPLHETVFSTAIKENYYFKNKFAPELNDEQVMRLSTLFHPAPAPHAGVSHPVVDNQRRAPTELPPAHYGATGFLGRASQRTTIPAVVPVSLFSPSQSAGTSHPSRAQPVTEILQVRRAGLSPHEHYGGAYSVQGKPPVNSWRSSDRYGAAQDVEQAQPVLGSHHVLKVGQHSGAAQHLLQAQAAADFHHVKSVGNSSHYGATMQIDQAQPTIMGSLHIPSVDQHYGAARKGEQAQLLQEGQHYGVAQNLTRAQGAADFKHISTVEKISSYGATRHLEQAQPTVGSHHILSVDQHHAVQHFLQAQSAAGSHHIERVGELPLDQYGAAQHLEQALQSSKLLHVDQYHVADAQQPYVPEYVPPPQQNPYARYEGVRKEKVPRDDRFAAPVEGQYVETFREDVRNEMFLHSNRDDYRNNPLGISAHGPLQMQSQSSYGGPVQMQSQSSYGGPVQMQSQMGYWRSSFEDPSRFNASDRGDFCDKQG